MKKDIETKEDIKRLIDLFYDKVKADDKIGFIFNDVVKTNWKKHLPVMYSFWENVLFYTGSYTGQPLNLHKNLHSITPLTLAHFERWNTLFDASVDELYQGKNAQSAKERAHSISTVMQIKILNTHNPIK